MADDFLGRGWRFPVRADLKTGEIPMSEYEQDIKEAIWIILSTRKGERIMRPDFGCGIHNYVFSSIDSSSIGMMESSIKEALIRWEPRINLLSVDVQPVQIENGRLLIDIQYEVRKTNNQFNLVYPFYLKEG